MTKRYERVTYRDLNGKTHCQTVEVLDETADVLYLKPVNKEGDDLATVRLDGVIVETRHLLSRDLITKRVRLVMNRTYGELEPMKGV